VREYLRVSRPRFAALHTPIIDGFRIDVCGQHLASTIGKYTHDPRRQTPDVKK
jgi:hypothetical protein